ncbi:hypothetical protein [Panacibacter ginsenosidivorans]|nr:hypothetical protein [Panacibacter ginsenosidivorans]
MYVSVGYEDGHIFEEVNNVQIELVDSGIKDDMIEAHIAEQQQQ